MKKVQVSTIIAALLFFGLTVSAQAADLKIGLGCEGMFFGPLIQGASARVWSGQIGGEANIFTGRVKAETDDSTMKVSLNSIGLKGMFAPVVKANSKFYVGAQLGYGDFKGNAGDFLGGGATYKGRLLTYGPLMGAEFSWQELPEIGINLEVGYLFNKIKLDNDADESTLDLNMDGINVSLGVHYYF